MSLRRNRCQFHPEREAGARCPGCERHFCRECVTEQEGVVYCWPCLERQIEMPPAVLRWPQWLGATALLIGGLLLQAGIFLVLLRPLADLGGR